MNNLSNNNYKDIFDSVASQYDKITNVYSVSRRCDILALWAQGDCLEVGAGTGEIAKGLMKKCRVVATDISPKMVEEIKKKLGIEAYVCDAEKLPFPENSFDTVVASLCIHYFAEPRNFLKEAYRVLKADGRLLILSPAKICGFYEFLRDILRMLGFKKMYFNDRNRNFMDIGTLQKMLNESGFKPLETKEIIILPFAFLDSVNRFLEQTLLRHLGISIVVLAKKN